MTFVGTAIRVRHRATSVTVSVLKLAFVQAFVRVPAASTMFSVVAPLSTVPRARGLNKTSNAMPEPVGKFTVVHFTRGVVQRTETVKFIAVPRAFVGVCVCAQCTDTVAQTIFKVARVSVSIGHGEDARATGHVIVRGTVVGRTVLQGQGLLSRTSASLMAFHSMFTSSTSSSFHNFN
jgi:hypothetical protein